MQNSDTISYKKQKLITDYFQKKVKVEEKIYGYNELTNSWHCLTCGVDMGPQNPRQLCGKWRCLSLYY